METDQVDNPMQVINPTSIGTYLQDPYTGESKWHYNIIFRKKIKVGTYVNLRFRFGYLYHVKRLNGLDVFNLRRSLNK